MDLVTVTYKGSEERDFEHDGIYYTFAPGETKQIPAELAHGRPAPELVDDDGQPAAGGSARAGLLAQHPEWFTTTKTAKPADSSAAEE